MSALFPVKATILSSMTPNGVTTPEDGIFQLVYVSSAVNPFSNEELEELLNKSRGNNEASGITGLLLYKGGHFMQFLEGPKESVIACMTRIKLDPRHRGVIVLLQERSLNRDFAEWSMRFKKLGDESDEQVVGHSNFVDEPLTSEEFVINPAKSLQLLRSFKQNIR
jgi:hypothetical protein